MTLTSVTWRRQDGSFVGIVDGRPHHITESSPYYTAAASVGHLAPFEPEPEPVGIEQQRSVWSMSDVQFAIAASSAPFNFMTDEEAQEWAGAGVIPAIGLAALATIPDTEARREATIRFRGARTFARLDPFITDLLQPFLSVSDEMMDAFFQLGMSK
ncbi:MAG: hypothetical protein DI533_00455 [Cereibacter sphaeroides]|uniref:Uncharacterized protein n=1 Tax=Cereibacter sphaeroides TaxID=1063 RepID=A0A2W5U6Z2_CERSP|nr:MAG: hypothetical protein DI533_00455 [Cereibacter sphaeroides]